MKKLTILLLLFCFCGSDDFVETRVVTARPNMYTPPYESETVSFVSAIGEETVGSDPRFVLASPRSCRVNGRNELFWNPDIYLIGQRFSKFFGS